MRWKTPKESKSALYNIKKWFALVPITIGDETRWMEWVEVEYRITIAQSDIVGPGTIIERPYRFVN